MESMRSWWLHLAGGVVSAALGFVALRGGPIVSAVIVAMWMTVWAAIAAALVYKTARGQSGAGAARGWMLLAAFFLIGAATLAFRYPKVTFATLVAVMGSFGIVGGLLMLGAFVGMFVHERRIKRAIREARAVEQHHHWPA